MKTPPKKLLSSKARPEKKRGGVRSTRRSQPKRPRPPKSSGRALRPARAAAGRAGTAALRRKFRARADELPTRLERDTALTPEWIAESVVQEAERFLQADLPADFTARLAAKAYYCYDHHRQFHKLLNEPGRRGRDALFMFMRHWTAGWLRRERPVLRKLLPWDYALGRKLKASPGD